MNWIYLSPHFDDVALSCGGLVWEQVRAGDSVSIWTVCAGSIPEGELSPFAIELHTRGDTGRDATTQRRQEDIHSCQRLGASYRYFTIPDCIYRHHPQTGEFMYASEAALNGPLQPGDDLTIIAYRENLKLNLLPDALIVCPLGLGNHVDHQLTRLAAEGLDSSLWYYADYPYILHSKEKLLSMAQEGWLSQVFPISQDGLVAWQDSIAAHASQISTFWMDEHVMRMAVSDYLGENLGIRLWKKLIM
jgi:LmbE family N-acetylglucosaminyl deacetylase